MEVATSAYVVRFMYAFHGSLCVLCVLCALNVCVVYVCVFCVLCVVCVCGICCMSGHVVICV